VIVHKPSTLWFSVALMIAPGSAAFAQGTESSAPPAVSIPSPAAGFFTEPRLFTKAIDAADERFGAGREPDDGPYVELGNMITGAGWVSAGPGYRHHVLKGRAVVDASATVSWNLYWAAQGRVEFPHLVHDRVTLGAQTMYQDLLAIEYFGLGSDSLKSDRSAYRLNNFDVLGFATLRATPWLSVDARLGRIDRIDLSTPTGINVSVPGAIDRFDESTALGIGFQPPFVHGDVGIAADTRDTAGHPTRGGLYRASAAAYSDRESGPYSFQRYEVEASQFVPVFTPNWILALHGWEVFSSAATGRVVPFYLLPSLGGENTLRGFYDYRFHDNDLQVFNAESRWALFAHIDVAAFVDAGKVASRAGDLDFTHLKTSYGAGLRVHSRTSALARVDVGHSREGWRIFFAMSDVFKRSSPALGRSAVIPFVP
jgi:surface antigen Omp85-like protein